METIKIRELKIFVFHYKPEPTFFNIPNYVHVWAGKNNSRIDTELVGDDTDDNISDKNKYFSELTGLYWVWKNQQSDIFGSCHYRRFFTNRKEPFTYRIKRFLYYFVGLHRKRFGLIFSSDLKLFEKAILTKDEILEILESFDAILPQSRKLRSSVKDHYHRCHNSLDLNMIEEILIEKCPEYLPAFNSVISGNRLYANNMFILKKTDFDRFMSWWFELLFEFESRINKADYPGYQQRILGFIAERLLTVWFYHQDLRIKELPLIYFKKLKK